MPKRGIFVDFHLVAAAPALTVSRPTKGGREGVGWRGTLMLAATVASAVIALLAWLLPLRESRETSAPICAVTITTAVPQPRPDRTLQPGGPRVSHSVSHSGPQMVPKSRTR